MLAIPSLLIHNTIITEMNEPQNEQTYHVLNLCGLSNKKNKRKTNQISEKETFVQLYLMGLQLEQICLIQTYSLISN